MTKKVFHLSGLLYALLSLIFMSGGVIKEDQLVTFLAKTKLSVSFDTFLSSPQFVPMYIAKKG
jgi:hypothetical protein